MRIGVVEKFGLKKRDGNGTLFGFLTEADGAEGGVYFNEKGIAPGSHFKENNRRGSLVVYELRRFKDGRQEAFHVRLLEELDGPEQLRLYRECRGENRDEELKLLREYWQHPNRIAKTARERVQIGVVKKFGLKDRYGSRFGFLKNLWGDREIYFDEKSLSPGLRKLYREEQRGQSPYSRKLFLADCSVIYREWKSNDRWSLVSVELPEELDGKDLYPVYQEWLDGNRGRELAWLLNSSLISLELLDQESDEDLVFLILMLKAGGHRVTGILKQRPELLLRSPEVCSSISRPDIMNTSLEPVTTDEQTAFLARHVTNEDAWFEIVRKLPDSLVLGCPQALAAVHHSRAVALLPQVDGTAGDETERTRFENLLTCIEWGRLTESETALLRPLLEREPDAYIASLILQNRTAKRSVAALIQWRPELLWTHPEVCACIEWSDIGDLPLDELIPADASECRHTLLAKFNWSIIKSPYTDTSTYTYRDLYMKTVRPMLERESDEYIISLIVQTKAAGKDAALLLERKPELLLTSPEVCACVGGEDIKDLPSLKALVQTDGQAAFLAEHAGDDAWSHIARQLHGTVLLRCQRAMNDLTEYQARSLLSEIDWAAAGGEDLARGRALLAKIDWSRPSETETAAVSPLLEQESDESMVSLITQARAAGKGVSALLAWKPELLLTSPEVCACVRRIDIQNLPLERLIRTDEQAAFLAEHAGEDAWNGIAPKLSGTLLLHCGRAMEQITREQLSALLAGADWTDTGEGNLEDYGALLTKLHWNTFPDDITAAASSLRGQGMALKLCWWQRMTGSMKIRLLMYLSCFAEDERAERGRFEDLQRIRQWEAGQKNRLVCAVLQFFAGIYIETASASYRNNFLEAHSMLMEYITDCFTQGIDVTPELSCLLEHCRDASVSSNHFCDGRSWINKGLVYCPGRGYPCPHYENMDLTKTEFRTARQRDGEADYKDLSFMDFLLNVGGIPDLNRDDIRIKVKEEYPFRISAYVNGLIRLRPHMKCSHCGELFHPRFEYAKLITARLPVTVFQCSKSGQDGEHDQDIYLNFCYRCHEIIDSRECCRREKLSASGAFEGVISVQDTLSGSGSQYGQYLCMHCGGSAQIVLHGASICPKCGCDDPMLVCQTRKGGIVCGECGYDSSKFRSKFEEKLAYH